MDSDQDDLEEELLAVAGRSRPSAGKKRPRKVSSSDEDYEEETVRAPRKRPASGRTLAEDDGEDLDSDFDDGYGSDLMGDRADRAKLAGMNELEREMELADRAETRDKELERRRTARMLKQQQQKAAQAGNMRSSTRQKGVDTAKRTAMAELVAAKNARDRKTSKEERRRRREEDEEVSDESEYEVSERSEAGDSEAGGAADSLELGRERRRDGGELSDDGRRGDEDDDDDDGVLTRRFHPDEETEDAEYRNIQDIQVRRYMLEKWQNEPFFERSLPGAVVRLAVGANRYFMAQIVHVEEREPGSYKDPGLYRLESPYEFPEKGGRTGKWLYVQRGTSPRLMPMTLVSNHGITEDEFRSWRTQCDKDNRPQVNLAEVAEVKDRLRKAATYVYTAEDVNKMIEDKRAKGDVRNLAKEKSRLVVRRAKALEDGDTEEAEKLATQIDELDSRAQERADRDRERRAADEPGRKSLAEVNKQNALRNMRNALQNVTSRPEGSRALTADGVDPFSRRQTRPMNYWSTGRRGAGAPEDAAEGAVGAAPSAPADVTTAAATENEAGGIDLTIDLSALQPAPQAALMRRRLLGPDWAAGLATRRDFVGRKILTLTDYKRRQGIA